MPRITCPPPGSDGTRVVFDTGWDALREEYWLARSSSASCRTGRSSRSVPRRSRRGMTCPTSSSRCSPARWRSMPASSSTPTTTSAASSTRSRTSACSTTRSSTTSSATTARRPRADQRHVQRDVHLQRRRALETAEFLASKIDEFGDPDGVQPLRRRLGACDGHALPVDEAGRVALGRHAQRHDRALAARHRGAGRVPAAVPPCDRRRPDHPRGGRLPEPTSSTASADADRGREHGLPFDDADAPERHETQYFEMFCNRGIYHEGWTAVTRHLDAVGHGDRCRRSTTTLGAVRHDHRLEPGTRSRRRDAGQALRAAGLWLRGAEVQRLPLDDRRIERFNPDLAGRPRSSRATRRLLFGSMGRLSENSVINVKNKSHAVTAEVRCPTAGAKA